LSFSNFFNILGYSTASDPNEPLKPSLMAEWLFFSFAKSKNGFIEDSKLFESLVLLIRGETRDCRKWAYERLSLNCKLSEGIHNSLHLLQNTLYSIGLKNRANRIQAIRAAEFLNSLESINSETYQSGY